MKLRIIYIHGNGAFSWKFAWGEWLKKELTKAGFETEFETMPDSVLARSSYWLPYLEDYAKASENDVLVGWSSGAVAAMRYAEHHRVRGSVLISPSYTDLDDDQEKQSGYFGSPWSWSNIKGNQQKIALFYGDDDPFIPQTEFEYISEKLDAETFPVHRGEHFIEQNSFPAVLKYLEETYSS